MLDILGEGYSLTWVKQVGRQVCRGPCAAEDHLAEGPVCGSPIHHDTVYLEAIVIQDIYGFPDVQVQLVCCSRGRGKVRHRPAKTCESCKRELQDVRSQLGLSFLVHEDVEVVAGVAQVYNTNNLPGVSLLLDLQLHHRQKNYEKTMCTNKYIIIHQTE